MLSRHQAQRRGGRRAARDSRTMVSVDAFAAPRSTVETKFDKLLCRGDGELVSDPVEAFSFLALGARSH